VNFPGVITVGGWPVDTYRVHIDQVPGPALSPGVDAVYGTVLVQYALDCVHVNVHASNRRTDSWHGYLRQAFIRELVRGEN
jgi:hypothetical protein